MLRGVKADKPALPIHDAVAVRPSGKEWVIRRFEVYLNIFNLQP